MPATAMTGRDDVKTVGRGNGSNGPLERVTVDPTGRASRALELATQVTGDTKTDTINRALQIYAYFEEVTARGGKLCPGSSRLRPRAAEGLLTSSARHPPYRPSPPRTAELDPAGLAPMQGYFGATIFQTGSA